MKQLFSTYLTLLFLLGAAATVSPVTAMEITELQMRLITPQNALYFMYEAATQVLGFSREYFFAATPEKIEESYKGFYFAAKRLEEASRCPGLDREKISFEPFDKDFIFFLSNLTMSLVKLKMSLVKSLTQQECKHFI